MHNHNHNHNHHQQQLNTTTNTSSYFTPGSTVEIIKTSKSTTSFHPATILSFEPHQPTPKKPKRNNHKDHIFNHKDPIFIDDLDDGDDDEEDLYLVQYKTQEQNDIVAYVGRDDIRPLLVNSEGENFVVDDKVDVFRDGFWVKGTIVGVLYEGSKYLVSVDGDNDDVPVEVSKSFLRLHRDWCYGVWVPPFDLDFVDDVKKDSIKMDQGSISRPGTISEVVTDSSGKRVTLRFKGRKTLLKTKFSPGTSVEVRSDEDGYQGSWFTATVVRSVGIDKFLVEYKTLTTEDETKPLRDVANGQDIRPCPPHVPHVNTYNVHDEVDAWYNDGWWEGAIFEVLTSRKYIVYFATSNEKLVFEHSNLRPHQNWVDGKWFIASQHRLSDLKSRSSSEMHYNQCQADQSFEKGAIVEIRNDEPGYEGSWYTATIVRLTQEGIYLVEYLTIKRDDKRRLLREEIEVQNIRPCPPKEVNDNYMVHEKVDAWYNEGWWAGVVSEVLADKKYKVYFNMSKEELEFHHLNLRARREWTNGKWIKVI